MSQIRKNKEEREVQVYGAGVIDMDASRLDCNQENLLAVARNLVDEMCPARDYYGKFAAEVTITIAILGETEEDHAQEE